MNLRNRKQMATYARLLICFLMVIIGVDALAETSGLNETHQGDAESGAKETVKDHTLKYAASITVTQTLVNDNNGAARTNDFVPMISNQIVGWNVKNHLFSGEYLVSEIALVTGYALATWGGDCKADGSIELRAGQDAICTVTNNDLPARLVLTHTVINNLGGGAVNTDFEVYVNGVFGAWGVDQMLDAGPYKLVISALDDYQNSQWTGDCAADGSIVLALAQVASCAIVTSEISAELVLKKSVSNTNANIGDIVTFSILVSNLGPETATKVKVFDVVTEGLAYQQGSIFGPDSRSDAKPYTEGLKWQIESLPVGVPVNLTFDAKILSP